MNVLSANNLYTSKWVKKYIYRASTTHKTLDSASRRAESIPSKRAKFLQCRCQCRGGVRSSPARRRKCPGRLEGAGLGQESHLPFEGCALSPDHSLHPRNPTPERDFLPDGQQEGYLGAGRNLGGMEGRWLRPHQRAAAYSVRLL